jgi:hypothetical protein
MTDRVTVTWRGRQYEAVRKGAGASGEPGAVWQVLRDGAPVTSFPVDGADGPVDVQEKVVGWLEGNRSRPEADIGRQ